MNQEKSHLAPKRVVTQRLRTAGLEAKVFFRVLIILAHDLPVVFLLGPAREPSYFWVFCFCLTLLINVGLLGTRHNLYSNEPSFPPSSSLSSSLSAEMGLGRRRGAGKSVRASGRRGVSLTPMDNTGES